MSDLTPIDSYDLDDSLFAYFTAILNQDYHENSLEFQFIFSLAQVSRRYHQLAVDYIKRFVKHNPLHERRCYTRTFCLPQERLSLRYSPCSSQIPAFSPITFILKKSNKPVKEIIFNSFMRLLELKNITTNDLSGILHEGNNLTNVTKLRFLQDLTQDSQRYSALTTQERALKTFLQNQLACLKTAYQDRTINDTILTQLLYELMTQEPFNAPDYISFLTPEWTSQNGVNYLLTEPTHFLGFHVDVSKVQIEINGGNATFHHKEQVIEIIRKIRAYPDFSYRVFGMFFSNFNIALSGQYFLDKLTLFEQMLQRNHISFSQLDFLLSETTSTYWQDFASPYLLLTRHLLNMLDQEYITFNQIMDDALYSDCYWIFAPDFPDGSPDILARWSMLILETFEKAKRRGITVDFSVLACVLNSYFGLLNNFSQVSVDFLNEAPDRSALGKLIDMLNNTPNTDIVERILDDLIRIRNLLEKLITDHIERRILPGERAQKIAALFSSHLIEAATQNGVDSKELMTKASDLSANQILNSFLTIIEEKLSQTCTSFPFEIYADGPLDRLEREIQLYTSVLSQNRFPFTQQDTFMQNVVLAMLKIKEIPICSTRERNISLLQTWRESFMMPLVHHMREIDHHFHLTIAPRVFDIIDSNISLYHFLSCLQAQDFSIEMSPQEQKAIFDRLIDHFKNATPHIIHFCDEYFGHDFTKNFMTLTFNSNLLTLLSIIIDQGKIKVQEIRPMLARLFQNKTGQQEDRSEGYTHNQNYPQTHHFLISFNNHLASLFYANEDEEAERMIEEFSS